MMKTFIAPLVLAGMCLPVQASTFEEIVQGSYLLYDSVGPACSTQAVSTEQGMFFLTAAHCVDDTGLSVHLQHKEEYQLLSEAIFYLDVVKKDVLTDIAVLKLKNEMGVSLFHPVDLASVEEANTLQMGDRVTVAGFPGTSGVPMQDLMITEGMFMSTMICPDPTFSKEEFYHTTAQVFYGSFNSMGQLMVRHDRKHPHPAGWIDFGVTI